MVDGSTDGATELLEAFKPLRSFRIFEQPNRGQWAALNRALEAARGDLILLIKMISCVIGRCLGDISPRIVAATGWRY